MEEQRVAVLRVHDELDVVDHGRWRDVGDVLLVLHVLLDTGTERERHEAVVDRFGIAEEAGEQERVTLPRLDHRSLVVETPGLTDLHQLYVPVGEHLGSTSVPQRSPRSGTQGGALVVTLARGADQLIPGLKYGIQHIHLHREPTKKFA